MMAKKKFVFPKQLLRQINECSNGGFIIFCFDEGGMPKIYSNFDNPQNTMAMQFFINNWSKSIEAFNIESAIAEIQGQIKGDEDDGENNEDKEK
jgi:hypothetical protein